MATSTIKGLTSSSTTSGILKVQKNGKVRVVDIEGEVTTQVIGSVDAPLTAVHGIGRWKNASNAYYPALVTVSAAGGVSASYFNGTTVTPITSGSLVATITYIVA